LGNHHITAIAVASIEISTCRGIVLSRCNHLEEIAAHWHQIVLEAEFAYSRINVAAVDAKYCCKVVNHRGELLGYKANLSKVYRHYLLPKRNTRMVVRALSPKGSFALR
jgi:hypothetical protein